MSIYHSFIPQSRLSAFVAAFWFYEGDEIDAMKEHRLPDGSFELVINLYENSIHVYDKQQPERFQCYAGSVVSGAHSEFAILDRSIQRKVIGVHFKPGGAFPFLGLPAFALRNTVVSLDCLWQTDAHDLRERLLEAETVTQKYMLLEKYLLACIPQIEGGHPAVTYALKQFQDFSHRKTIAAIAEEIGLSQTRFVQLFRQWVGLTPVQFYRVRRFQTMLHLLETRSDLSWIDNALYCGYFDQAHFNHEFRAFSGHTPEEYSNAFVKYRNHLPLHS